MTTARRAMTRHDRLLRSLEGAASVVVVTHDNPDPDAIASAWGVVYLVERMLKVPARIVAGGVITRAENRRMVDLLHPPLELVEDCDLEEDCRVVVVDTQHPARLDGLRAGDVLSAVIDHHSHERSSNGNGSRERPAVKFRDIRPNVLATSSMVAGYLKSLDLVPDRILATALLYGIHTDAQGWDAKFSRTDRAAIARLAQFSDPELRAQIERAPISRSYFEDLILALQNAFIYENAAICFLPSCDSFEVVGEVADLLLRCEGVQRVLCGAVNDSRMFFSARTSDRGGSAAYLLRKTVGKDGSCGGHKNRAGGTLPLKFGDGGQAELESKLRARWLEACNVHQPRGKRLVAKREILKALD